MNKKLTIYVMFFGMAFTSSTIPAQDLKESINRGKEVYVTYCQNCHMETGEGTPGINPPLAKADYLKKPANTLINIILKGESGELVVNGQKYNVPMPAQEYLTDTEIADVLNYIKNSWGNKLPGNITPAMVKANRNK
jgi:mono/diheme cytochrome c family protein